MLKGISKQTKLAVLLRTKKETAMSENGIIESSLAELNDPEVTLKTLKEVREILGTSEGQSVIDRARHFANADKFVPTDRIILGAMKTDKGIAVMVGECSRNELEISLTRITYRTHEAFRFGDMQQALKNRAQGNGVIAPQGAGEIIKT